MDKVRFCVIGIGRMGSVHAVNLLKGRVKGAELAAVCDISEKAVEAFRKKGGKRAFDIPSYSDFKEMLKAILPDAVIVATPHYQHVEIAMFALEKGVNVVIEKPVSVTTAEAEKLNAYLTSNGSAVPACAVMYNQRTNPVYKRAKALLDGGEVGNLKRISFIVTDWYRSQAYYDQNEWRASLKDEGGGVLINQCVHQLDILRWLVGMPETITAKIFTKGRKITAENDVTAMLGYKDDVFCTLSASGHELKGTNRIEIAGEKGRLVIGQYSMKFYKFKKSEPEVNASTKFGYGGAPYSVKRYFYGMKIIPDLLRGQQINILRNFTNHLRFGEKLISPATDGIYALSLINGIYLSAWQNRTVNIPEDLTEYVAALAEKVKAEKGEK